MSDDRIAVIDIGRAVYGNMEHDLRVVIWCDEQGTTFLQRQAIEDDGGAVPTEPEWFRTDTIQLSPAQLDEAIRALTIAREKVRESSPPTPLKDVLASILPGRAAE